MTVAVKPRKAKSDRLREEAIAEAERLAALLCAAPPEKDEHLSPPAFIKDKRLAPALAMWKELAPHLVGSGRLLTLDRSTFAALCYWHAEWIAAIDDIQARGYSFMGNATAGGTRPWLNPSVARRDTAWDQILTLSVKFGLTPLDRIALNKGKPYSNDDELPLTYAPTAQPVGDGAPKEDASDRWAGLLKH